LDLDRRNLPIEVPRREALNEEFHTMHLGFDTAAAVVSCQVSPSARPRYLDDRTASLRALALGVSGFHILAFLRGSITACASRAAIASWHLRVS
jgi:hypothetical protein